MPTVLAPVQVDQLDPRSTDRIEADELTAETAHDPGLAASGEFKRVACRAAVDKSAEGCAGLKTTRLWSPLNETAVGPPRMTPELVSVLYEPSSIPPVVSAAIVPVLLTLTWTLGA